MVIWRFTDGRRGHDAQSRGLAQAIGRIERVDCHDLAVPGFARSLAQFLRLRPAPGQDRPDPDLLIGAGHATHLPLLAARRRRGGRAIVLMSPSVPPAWFDFCLIPEHDDPPPGGNIIATRGPLNCIVAAPAHASDQGLILIGGPSPHYLWRQDELLGQIETILAGPIRDWCIADSPRTPLAARAALRALSGNGVRFVAHEETGTDWLPAQLARAATVWVSPDSLSMIYEALSAGAGVGVLDLPVRRHGRVSRAVELLAANAEITTYRQWRSGSRLTPPAQPLREADRCAELLLQRLP